jgi:maltooligosyltrehalose trehalohydrolase
VLFESSDRSFGLEREPAGYFSGLAPDAAAGALYRYRLDGSDLVPDPASRFQPAGPHGPSEVVDPFTYRWSDAAWPGVTPEGQVLYELHVGTFTRSGTWDGARERLRDLSELGVTVLELMPVAEFPGEFGWGYDGVLLFAPTRLYGAPDAFRRFVDAAHGLGLGVILDVVYNHFGPDGNHLSKFSETYFSAGRRTDWGDAVNYDGDGSSGARELAIANAAYWIEEFHLDGLRFDATQDIHDASQPHVLSEIAAAARAAAGARSLMLVAECESQETRLVKPRAADGYGLDALWNDDFHHTAMVALTGRREAYYTDYLGSPQELVSVAKYGYLYQGQRYAWQKKRRGTPAYGLPRSAFVNYLQNHDQIANSAHGERLHRLAGPAHVRALTAWLLLAPGTPLLFQGQEFAADAPFLYFADHKGDLGEGVRNGRRDFMAQFESLASPEWDGAFADPTERKTFERCVLDHEDAKRHAEIHALHRDLIRLRRSDPILSFPLGLDGAVLGERAAVLRYFGPGQDDRLLVLNLASDLHLEVAPEPLLAPPLGCFWETVWSSEARAYGGGGTPPLDTEDGWRLPAESAVLLAPRAAAPPPPNAS